MIYWKTYRDYLPAFRF